MAQTAAILRIEGRVQGVGYRWWAVGQARALALRGWVRNRADGSVELLAIGGIDAVEALAAACRGGPSGAQVSDVRRVEADDDGSEDFTERATL